MWISFWIHFLEMIPLKVPISLNQWAELYIMVSTIYFERVGPVNDTIASQLVCTCKKHGHIKSWLTASHASASYLHKPLIADTQFLLKPSNWYCQLQSWPKVNVKYQTIYQGEQGKTDRRRYWWTGSILLHNSQIA